MEAGSEPQKCGGPGSKIIFATKVEALAELRKHGEGKRANARQGKVYHCPWGDHWHYSSKRNGGKLR